MQKSDHRHPRLLRPRRERPRRRAAEQRDEHAAPERRGHSITSSASARSLSGIWKPSAFAVLRLITSRPLQPIRKDLVIRFRRQRLVREAIMAAKEISVKK